MRDTLINRHLLRRAIRYCAHNGNAMAVHLHYLSEKKSPEDCEIRELLLYTRWLVRHLESPLDTRNGNHG